MAAPLPPKPLLVAVDTNVLLDLAEGSEHAWGAVETIRRRLKNVRIVVLPTVIQELAHLVENGDTPRERELAGKAAQQLVKDWKFAPPMPAKIHDEFPTCRSVGRRNTK